MYLWGFLANTLHEKHHLGTSMEKQNCTVDLFNSNHPGTKKIYKHLQNRKTKGWEKCTTMFYKSISPGHRKVFHQGTDKEQIIFTCINMTCNPKHYLSHSQQWPFLKLLIGIKPQPLYSLGSAQANWWKEMAWFAEKKRQNKPVQVIENYYLVFNSYMYVCSLKTQQEPWEYKVINITNTISNKRKLRWSAQI